MPLKNFHTDLVFVEGDKQELWNVIANSNKIQKT
jgi:hypothetical protein